MTGSEHQMLVVDYNNTAASYPSDRTIVDLFVDQVRRTPDAEAIRLGHRSLTYAELDHRTNQMSALLRTRGVTAGDLVPIFMDHSIEVIVAILGVLKSGAAYVPADPASPKERLSFMLRDIAAGGRNARVVTQAHLAAGIPAETILLDESLTALSQFVPGDRLAPAPQDLAYVIYTSGSTGTPKGVMIEHRSLVNYVWWASETYCRGERLTFPLFSSLAFDLTVTSIFTPLISGGRIVVYREDRAMPGMVVMDVIEDNLADIIKLTPAHLAMIKDARLDTSRIRRMILGGEDLKTALARDITFRFSHPVEIYNEYGPTEATVGCMVHRYDIEKDLGLSVPIGVPAANAGVYVLDAQLQPVRPGMIGEMYLAGDGLARGYFNRPELTAERFVTAGDPRNSTRSLRLYRTGDIARWSLDGRMEFLGRADHQVKVGAARVELGEIEARLAEHPDVRECVVDVVNPSAARSAAPVNHCARCGVASNLPGTTFDDENVCSVCRSYETYASKAEAYFKDVEALKTIVAEMKATRTGDYDCLVMLSGGKDSTYMLYQLCNLGLKPLVFTLDNGFLSDEAKANIKRVVDSLRVDHVFGSTPYMNDIFVDSLKRYANVCNGCFKTIYTLCTTLAHEKRIRYIVTGLSRGQFFETRLTEDVFQRKDFDVNKLDELVLEARKAYHRRKDAVSCHIEADVFRDDNVFEEIRFVDFYRYWSVPLAEMYAFLRDNAPWTRPSDTGRSTNCLINDVGIYVHKKERGFHNYALPYSWDVRLGQKTREEAMAELDDAIDEARVREIMARIGYSDSPGTGDSGTNRLAAYYVSDEPVAATALREHLAKQLPDYMIPSFFIRLERLPLTSNGKVDRKSLPSFSFDQAQTAQSDAVKPRTDTEKGLAAIWSELLNVPVVGVNDDFFDLGGQSLTAIKAVSRIRQAFDVDLALRNLFEQPTVAGLSGIIDRLSWSARAGAMPQSVGEREEIAF